MEGVLKSPDDLLAAGRDIVLEGREPETERDWLILVNFFSFNIRREVQPIAVELICTLYNAPVTREQIHKICAYQVIASKSRKEGGE